MCWEIRQPGRPIDTHKPFTLREIRRNLLFFEVFPGFHPTDSSFSVPWHGNRSIFNDLSRDKSLSTVVESLRYLVFSPP
jgi:hypothetical protein